MTWRQHHCWSLDCDACGEGWTDLGGAPHFDSQEDLKLYAKQAGWAITPARAVCASCLLEELCALNGHSWGPWTHLEPSPLSVHPVARRVRFCLVCTSGEHDPPLGAQFDLGIRSAVICLTIQLVMGR